MGGTITGTPGLAQPNPAELASTVDGASIGALVVDRGRAQPLVPLASLARALGWHVQALSNGARVQGDDRNVFIRIGSRSIREDNQLRPIFAEPPLERGGTLYLAASDAARLFGLSVLRSPGVLAFRRPAQLGGASEIIEITAPPAPRPRPTPRPARQTVNAEAALHASAGRILISMDRSGASSMFQVAAATSGSYLQTQLAATGVNQLGLPTGTVTVGSKERNLEIGGFSDPLNGLILHGGAAQGLDYYRADLRRDVFAGRRLGDGTSLVGIVSGAPGNGGSDVVAMLFRDGAYDQTIVRRLRIERKPWGDFTRELLFGDRGVGAGFRARTRGRTFVESTASFATPGLPLGPNDAPISVDVGRALSDQTTVVGGFATGPQQPLGPFAAISTRSRALQAALSATSRTVTASLSYQTPDASLQVYAIPGLQHASGAQARFNLQRATIDLNLTNSAGSRDASLELRTAHAGINLIAGAALPGAGRAGPIVGVSVPLGSVFALEATRRPAGSGSALRVSLAVGIAARRPRQAATLAALVRVAADQSGAPMQLFVDSAPVLSFRTPTVKVNVTPGRHTFAVERVDGTAGSIDVAVDIEAAGDTIALSVWPERSIAGHVELDAAAVAPADFSLARIIVVIQPGNITTETAADGSFVFPMQPFAPDATVGVDAGSLPRTLRAADPFQPPAGDVRLVLRPGLLIESTHFGAKTALRR